MGPASEAILINRLRDGDTTAMGVLYDHFADALYGVVCRIVQDDALAADILQDSFVKVWQNADQYDPEKSRLFTWMLRICRNTAIDRIRQRQRRNTREIQTSAGNVWDKGSEQIQPQHLDLPELVQKLDRKYREVLNLLFFQGMTQQEVSDTLGIPLGTVKSRLKVSLRELRAMYHLAGPLIFGHLVLLWL